jgi:membrane-associated protein
MPSLQAVTDALARAAVFTGPWAPAVLFLATFLEHVFPPWPGDLLVVLGAWYVVQGQLSWAVLLAAGTAGAVCGAWVDHRVGVALGRRLDRGEWSARWLTPQRLAAFEVAYRRWGWWLIAGNRFLPGLRGFLFVAAGATGLPVGRVMALGGLSALVWNGLLLAAGALLATNLEELLALAGRFSQGLGAVLAVTALGLAARAWWRRRDDRRQKKK